MTILYDLTPCDHNVLKSDQTTTTFLVMVWTHFPNVSKIRHILGTIWTLFGHILDLGTFMNQLGQILVTTKTLYDHI